MAEMKAVVRQAGSEGERRERGWGGLADCVKGKHTQELRVLNAGLGRASTDAITGSGPSLAVCSPWTREGEGRGGITTSHVSITFSE